MNDDRRNLVADLAAGWAARALAAKLGAAPLLVLLGVLLLALLLVLCVVLTAMLQVTTLTWPAAQTDAAGYRAGGWRVQSEFGWRAAPHASATSEFHDGVDLAGGAFCRGCPAAALFDAKVQHIGWDNPTDRMPQRVGSGQTVVLSNGAGEMTAFYGHLEPYRLYVRVEGRIDDSYDRYAGDAEYAPLGTGERQPPIDRAMIATTCSGEPPVFVADQIDLSTWVFLYDRPATCTTTVTWPQRGDGWQGWRPGAPGGGRQSSIGWSTPVDLGRRADDVALRFQGDLRPPPPAPSPTPVATPVSNLIGEQGAPATFRVLRISSAALRRAQPVPQPTSEVLPTPPPLVSDDAPPAADLLPAPSCPVLDLVPLVGVRNAHGTSAGMQLAAPAAASFAAIRAEVQALTGADPLGRLADALRAPEFRTDKPGVARMSWHMTGRAVDVDTSAAWHRVREGRYWRLLYRSADVTAIFLRHGWQRIPDQAESAEWWHYEYHPDGVGWAGAMRQVWSLERLRAAFPDLGWSSGGCGALPGLPELPPLVVAVNPAACVPQPPRFDGALNTWPGCGPPLRVGDAVYQLASTLGFVGTTGRVAGPALHVGLRVLGHDGALPSTNICTPRWLAGHILPPGAACTTELVDPLEFLPRAQADLAVDGTTVPAGAPYQLPPPGHPDALVATPPPGTPAAGQYWSPHADGGAYGGGDVGTWLRDASCAVFPDLIWCR